LRGIESRGATVKDIAALTEISVAKVQEYLAVNGQEPTNSPRAKKRAAPAADADPAGATAPAAGGAQ